MKQKKIVFFEELHKTYEEIFLSYLRKGYQVYCFNINRNFVEERDIKNCLESGVLTDLSTKVFKFSLSRKAAFFAHKNVDCVFDNYFSTMPSIKNMTKLLECPEIIDMFKKELLLILEEIYENELKINEITKSSNSSDDIHFVPRSDYGIHADDSSPLNKNIIVINYTNLRIKFKHVFERLFTDDFKSPKKGLIPLFYPSFLFLKKFKGVSKNKRPPKTFKVGITINHPKSLFAMNYFTDTIFIDEHELPKEEVLFIDESGDVNIEGYKKAGYNYVRLKDDRVTISCDLLKKFLITFLPIWIKTVFISLFKEPSFIDTKRRILQDYVLWNILLEDYYVINHLKRMIPDNISKNHILSDHKIKTWFIVPDNSSVDVFLDWNESLKNQTLFSFIHCDYAVIYGDLVERYFRKHRNSIKKYFKTGVLYSQIVREIEEEKLKSSLPALIEGKKMPEKIVGIFDTTFVDWGPVKVEEGIRFGENILRLLNDYPKIGFVFKAKKELKLTPALISIYNKLKKHDRCVFIARYEEEGISSPEVVAVSNLVISAAYTSTTAEALGARKRAIYYDVAGHDIGDKYYYNRFPNFVAHNYGALKRLVEYWLYEATDDDFTNLLDKYVKDEIDPYLDGMALSRMRKLLMEG